MALAKFRFPSILTLAAGVAAIATSALAQVKTVEPYSVTVATDKVDLRCADLTQAYRVAQVAKGTTLLVDGEGQTGLRVAYPAGASAFIRAEDADFDTATNLAKLNKGSRLRAAQFGTNYEFSKSWKGLLDAELPPGTELKVVETVKAADGTAIAYRVEAPATARAFISLNAVRKADGSAVTKSTPKTETPAKAETPVNTDPSLIPVEPKTGVTPVPEGTNPAAPVTLTPGGTTTTTTTQITRITKPVNKLDGLETAFRNIRTQAIDDAEIEPLLAEYRAALAELPGDSRRGPQLNQRIEYLQFQRDLQDKKRALAEIERQADERTQSLLAAVNDVERTRVYTIIGMLLPSTVYDGTNMPLMYRIQSVGGVTPRTLGYLKPSEATDAQGALDIKSKIGLIVGVIGEASIDPTLQLNIVSPVRVDPLRASMTPTGSTTLEVIQSSTTTTGPDGTSTTKTTDTSSTTVVPAIKPDPEK